MTGSRRTSALPPDWGRRRMAVFRKYRGRCASCGGVGTEVDHIHPCAFEGAGRVMEPPASLWRLPFHQDRQRGSAQPVRPAQPEFGEAAPREAPGHPRRPLIRSTHPQKPPKARDGLRDILGPLDTRETPRPTEGKGDTSRGHGNSRVGPQRITEGTEWDGDPRKLKTFRLRGSPPLGNPPRNETAADCGPIKAGEVPAPSILIDERMPPIPLPGEQRGSKNFSGGAAGSTRGSNGGEPMKGFARDRKEPESPTGRGFSAFRPVTTGRGR
jgi:hypothetical protein